jgi:Methylase involved in ubiquinone/menaquinone biosynthesis
MKLHLKDKNEIIKLYNDRYDNYGYSPKTLGWKKGKQNIRFEILTSLYNFENKSVIDIGCGFGDLNISLREKILNYKYTGIDLTESLIKKAKEIYGDHHVNFQVGDFLEMEFDETFDYAIVSGMFNYKLNEIDNYTYVERVMEKALELSRDGIAFDFLSDKVDYKNEIGFYYSPEKILSIAYKFSKNIVLRSDYMPFEFSLFVFKDDSFSKEDVVFRRYNNLNKFKN